MNKKNIDIVNGGFARTVASVIAIVAIVAQLLFPIVGIAAAASPTPAANPQLSSQSCGLDIALVIDDSGSMAPGLSQMKTDLHTFVNALAATPTEFSVTKFSSSASIVSQFTAVTANTNASIDSALSSASGSTNWQDGLTKAKSTFDASDRAGHPNLVIFASDGDPNVPGNGSGFVQAALGAAVTVANTLKDPSTYNAKILAIGITGNGGLRTTSLEAISGANLNTGDIMTTDVITGDVTNLASSLASAAVELCGGTITMTKMIDADGNGNLNSGGTGWTFKIGDSTYPTDPNGKTKAVISQDGTYDVMEAMTTEQQNNYKLLSASCLANGIADGTFDSADQKVAGVAVDGQKIVACTFVNTPLSHILVKNNVVPDNGGSSFTFVTAGTNYAGFSLVAGQQNDSGPLTPGVYSVSETQNPNYILTAACDNGQDPEDLNIGYGQTVTCTFTNTQKGGITITKVTDPDQDPTQFVFHPSWADAFTLSGVTGSNSMNFGSLAADATSTVYSISEDIPAGWDQSGVNCVDEQNDMLQPSNLVLNPNGSIACTFTNIKYGSIVVTQNTAGGDAAFGLSGNNGIGNFDITTDGGTGSYTVKNVLPGTYSIADSSLPNANWSQTGTDCDNVKVEAGQTANCTISDAYAQPRAKLLVTISADSDDGSGTVTSNESTPVIDCHVSASEKCSAEFDLDHSVTLTAVPDAGSTFAGTWSGACSGDTPTCTLTMDSDKTVNAHFSLISANGGNGGGSGAPVIVVSGGSGSNSSSGQFMPGYTTGGIAPQVLGASIDLDAIAAELAKIRAAIETLAQEIAAMRLPGVLGAATMVSTGVLDN